MSSPNSSPPIAIPIPDSDSDSESPKLLLSRLQLILETLVEKRLHNSDTSPDTAPTTTSSSCIPPLTLFSFSHLQPHSSSSSSSSPSPSQPSSARSSLSHIRWTVDFPDSLLPLGFGTHTFRGTTDSGGFGFLTDLIESEKIVFVGIPRNLLSEIFEKPKAKAKLKPKLTTTTTTETETETETETGDGDGDTEREEETELLLNQLGKVQFVKRCYVVSSVTELEEIRKDLTIVSLVVGSAVPWACLPFAITNFPSVEGLEIVRQNTEDLFVDGMTQLHESASFTIGRTAVSETGGLGVGLNPTETDVDAFMCLGLQRRILSRGTVLEWYELKTRLSLSQYVTGVISKKEKTDIGPFGFKWSGGNAGNQGRLFDGTSVAVGGTGSVPLNHLVATCVSLYQKLHCESVEAMESTVTVGNAWIPVGLRARVSRLVEELRKEPELPSWSLDGTLHPANIWVHQTESSFREKKVTTVNGFLIDLSSLMMCNRIVASRRPRTEDEVDFAAAVERKLGVPFFGDEDDEDIEVGGYESEVAHRTTWNGQRRDIYALGRLVLDCFASTSKEREEEEEEEEEEEGEVNVDVDHPALALLSWGAGLPHPDSNWDEHVTDVLDRHFASTKSVSAVVDDDLILSRKAGLKTFLMKCLQHDNVSIKLIAEDPLVEEICKESSSRGEDAELTPWISDSLRSMDVDEEDDPTAPALSRRTGGNRAAYVDEVAGKLPEALTSNTGSLHSLLSVMMHFSRRSRYNLSEIKDYVCRSAIPFVLYHSAATLFRDDIEEDKPEVLQRFSERQFHHEVEAKDGLIADLREQIGGLKDLLRSHVDVARARMEKNVSILQKLFEERRVFEERRTQERRKYKNVKLREVRTREQRQWTKVLFAGEDLFEVIFGFLDYAETLHSLMSTAWFFHNVILDRCKISVNLNRQMLTTYPVLDLLRPFRIRAFRHRFGCRQRRQTHWAFKNMLFDRMFLPRMHIRQAEALDCLRQLVERNVDHLEVFDFHVEVGIRATRRLRTVRDSLCEAVLACSNLKTLSLYSVPRDGFPIDLPKLECLKLVELPRGFADVPKSVQTLHVPESSQMYGMRRGMEYLESMKVLTNLKRLRLIEVPQHRVDDQLRPSFEFVEFLRGLEEVLFPMGTNLLERFCSLPPKATMKRLGFPVNYMFFQNVLNFLATLHSLSMLQLEFIHDDESNEEDYDRFLTQTDPAALTCWKDAIAAAQVPIVDSDEIVVDELLIRFTDSVGNWEALSTKLGLVFDFQIRRLILFDVFFRDERSIISLMDQIRRSVSIKECSLRLLSAIDLVSLDLFFSIVVMATRLLQQDSSRLEVFWIVFEHFPFVARTSGSLSDAELHKLEVFCDQLEKTSRMRQIAFVGQLEDTSYEALFRLRELRPSLKTRLILPNEFGSSRADYQVGW